MASPTREEKFEPDKEQQEQQEEPSGEETLDTSQQDKVTVQQQQQQQQWSQQHREKLLHLLSKIFLLNFPLYIAMKHGGATNPLAPVKVHCSSSPKIQQLIKKKFSYLPRTKAVTASPTIPRCQPR